MLLIPASQSAVKSKRSVKRGAILFFLSSSSEYTHKKREKRTVYLNFFSRILWDNFRLDGVENVKENNIQQQQHHKKKRKKEKVSKGNLLLKYGFNKVF